MKTYQIECDSIETAHFYTRAELKKMFSHAVEVKTTDITPDLLNKGAEALGRNSGISPTIYYTQAQVDMLLSAHQPTANADLVGEVKRCLDHAHPSVYGSECDEYWWKGYDKKEEEIKEILSKYRPVPVVKEQGEEGLAKALRDLCVVYGERANTEKDAYKAQVWFGMAKGMAKALDIMLGYPIPTPAPVASGFEYEWKNGIQFTKEEKKHIEMVRDAGCKCNLPLLGYRPNKGPRCRMCGVEAVEAPSTPQAEKVDRTEEASAAKLAFDKEWLYDVSSSGGFYWRITLRPKSINQGVGCDFYGHTYAECEAKARQYLNGLPNAGEGR